jgi:predicted flap endonuclease-1-like 5' DNA nuclease
LEQLRDLNEDSSRRDELAQTTDLRKPFLDTQAKRAAQIELKNRIGTAIWKKLEPKGIESINDLAQLAKDDVESVANELEIDADLLENYRQESAKLIAP